METNVPIFFFPSHMMGIGWKTSLNGFPFQTFGIFYAVKKNDAISVIKLEQASMDGAGYWWHFSSNILKVKSSTDFCEKRFSTNNSSKSIWWENCQRSYFVERLL